MSPVSPACLPRVSRVPPQCPLTLALLSSWHHMGWQRRLARKSISARHSCGSGSGAGGSAALTDTSEAGSDSSPATIVGTVASDELGPESDGHGRGRLDGPCGGGRRGYGEGHGRGRLAGPCGGGYRRYGEGHGWGGVWLDGPCGGGYRRYGRDRGRGGYRNG